MLVTPGRPDGQIRVQGSKSETNRALLVAALAEGQSSIDFGLVSDDSLSMCAALSTLGAGVQEIHREPDGSWLVNGFAGTPRPAPQAQVDCHLAGTTLRFVSAIATLSATPVVITGAAPLLARPVGPLIDALRQLGADVRGNQSEAGLRPPLTVGGRVQPSGGEAHVDATRSSQFVSALAMLGPLLTDGLRLRWRGLAARGYVDLSFAIMRRHGIEFELVPDGADIPGGQTYRAGNEIVPGDASSASHLFTAAAAAGGRVTVTDIASSRAQPDFAVLDALTAMGAMVSSDGDAITVVGPESLEPIDWDLTATPDQLPNLAVLAALARGRSRFTGVEVTRYHETDRVTALQRELARVGARCEDDGDAFIVHGGGALTGARLDTHHDHRLGMAFAALGCAVEGIEVADAGCVAKTYPRFWSDLRALGVDWNLVT